MRTFLKLNETRSAKLFLQFDVYRQELSCGEFQPARVACKHIPDTGLFLTDV